MEQTLSVPYGANDLRLLGQAYLRDPHQKADAPDDEAKRAIVAKDLRCSNEIVIAYVAYSHGLVDTAMQHARQNVALEPSEKRLSPDAAGFYERLEPRVSEELTVATALFDLYSNKQDVTGNPDFPATQAHLNKLGLADKQPNLVEQFVILSRQQTLNVPTTASDAVTVPEPQKMKQRVLQEARHKIVYAI